MHEKGVRINVAYGGEGLFTIYCEFVNLMGYINFGG